ncbi:MAG TPA: response regulator transcription factor [Trueperaceae bacterium]|nr:response regulator transcription factor [Trueperaceae bacterium]
MARILLVEDDDSTRMAISRFLSLRGHQVLEVEDGDNALHQVSEADLVVLDIMLPRIDGWQVADYVRSHYPDKPLLMLTALGAVEHRLKGFDLGADDYMVKPVDLHELEARLRVALRRSGHDEVLVRGDLVLNTSSKVALLEGNDVGLSALEFDVLATLARRPGQILSRERLIDEVWGPDYDGIDRTVDVRIANIRRKLGEAKSGKRYIETVRNGGYRFRIDA